MKEIEQFVNRLFSSKTQSKEDKETVPILIEMLEEKVEDLKEEGMNESDAIDKTIAEFGEIDDYYHPHMDKEKRRHKRQKTIEHYKNDLLFSALSTAIIIAIIGFVNLYYFPQYGPWFIVPALGILFWPLSLLYKLLNKKGENK